MVMTLSLSDLPEDLQVLLLQVIESRDAKLKEEDVCSLRLPIRKLPMRIFPNIPIATDDRDISYAEAMIGQRLPPVVICGKQWIDGRHRIWALKRSKVKEVDCIDLQDIIGFYSYEIIAMTD